MSQSQPRKLDGAKAGWLLRRTDSRHRCCWEGRAQNSGAKGKEAEGFREQTKGEERKGEGGVGKRMDKKGEEGRGREGKGEEATGKGRKVLTWRWRETNTRAVSLPTPSLEFTVTGGLFCTGAK